MLTTSVECSILSAANISNVPEREADAPDFSGYANTAMTSIAACNQNDEGDETNTSHSELEDNDKSCWVLKSQYCLHRRLHSTRLSLYKVSLHLLELRNTLTSKHYAKGMALHAIFKLARPKEHSVLFS